MKIDVYVFKVEIPLMGYRRPKDANSNYRKYTRYKRDVMLLAMEAGFRAFEPARVGRRVSLAVAVYWDKHAKSDWSNIYKGIEDALFKCDRYVEPGRGNVVKWDNNNGRDVAVVRIEVEA